MSDVFRLVGPEGAPNPFAPKPRFELTSAELAELAITDPLDPVGHARIRGIRSRVARRSSGLTSPDSQLVDWLIGQLRDVEVPAGPTPETYENPCRLLEGGRPQRPLDAGDFAFVQSVAGTPADQVSSGDARLLAELHAVSSTASERAVVERVLAPVRRFYDRQEEESVLRAEVAGATAPRRRPEVVAAIEPFLAARLADERRQHLEEALAAAPEELRDQFDVDAEAAAARRRAPGLINDRWAALEAEVAERTARGQVRLHELVCGAEPVSSEAGLPPLPDPSLADARERGRQWREQRAGDPDAFSKFETIGAAGGSGSAA